MKGAGRAVGREKGRKTFMPIRPRRFGPWALHCPKNGAVARPSDHASIVARRGFYFHSIAVRARLSLAAKQTIFAFVPAALGLLALILTAAAVQIVSAQLFRDASEIAGFAPRY
jgi:hypothetical protein